MTLHYKPSTAGFDMGKYDMTLSGVFGSDVVTDYTQHDLPRLMASDNWEDRIRAEILRSRLSPTLPDQFPCIYETADSPSHSRHLNKRPHPWVVSPDIDMLQALLPDYQELWDSYTARWGESARRTMTVGRLDGLSPRGVYRPGATPAQVIGTTMLTHTDMCAKAPERLRAMHPQYERWQAARQR